jgi:hypothetical protein
MHLRILQLFICVDSIICFFNQLIMSRIKQIIAWVALIGGGIAFFFFSIWAAEVMR